MMFNSNILNTFFHQHPMIPLAVSCEQKSTDTSSNTICFTTRACLKTSETASKFGRSKSWVTDSNSDTDSGKIKTLDKGRVCRSLAQIWPSWLNSRARSIQFRFNVDFVHIRHPKKNMTIYSERIWPWDQLGSLTTLKDQSMSLLHNKCSHNRNI